MSRSPGPQSPPRPPRNGPLYAVRYVDHAGQTVTQTYARRASADRQAALIAGQGGSPEVWWTTTNWTLGEVMKDPI